MKTPCQQQTVNPHDSSAQQRGLFIEKTLPTPLAIDIVGTVEKLGPGVTDFRTDERVFYLGEPTVPDRSGTQEYVLARADYVGKAPAAFSSDDIATMTLNPWTAFLALFAKQGLEIPGPTTPERETFDYAAQSVLVIGGGSACGKYVIQWAKYVGIGNIIAVASKGKSEAELKKMGATHFIDRHGSIDAIDKEVRSIVGDDLIYAVDCVNRGPGGLTLGAKALSNSKKGKLAQLVLTAQVDEALIGEKKAGYERRPVFAGNQSDPELVKEYFKKVVAKMEDGTIQPTPYSVIHGLDAAKVNEALDAYRDGNPITKPHVHL